MITRLGILRSQITGLRRARANARQLSAAVAIGIAIVASLVAVFLLDWFFQREIQAPQRFLLLLAAAGVVVWAYYYFARKLLAVQETDVDIALMVERQQGIDSDLVAAIQFEDDVEGRWGSRELETAVIDYVAHLGPDIDVFQGFDRNQLRRRATILGVLVTLVLLAGLIFPGYLGAFLNRIALGSAHYPSATQIETLAVNGRNVLTGGMQPENIRCAEGREVEFLIRCEGQLVDQGTAALAAQSTPGLAGLFSAKSAQRTTVDLKPLTTQERLQRLQQARQLVEDARGSQELDLAGPWLENLAALVQYESPQDWAALQLDTTQPATELGRQVEAKLDDLHALIVAGEKRLTAAVAASGPQEYNVDGAALYVGHLPRLNEPVSYRVSLGDAYTDPSDVAMIALPAVEARLTPVPPKYAAKALAAQPSGRQAAVLVGSEVRVAIECTNNKPLKEAWIVVRPASGSQAKRYDLVAQNPERTQWTLASQVETPFGNTETPFRKVQEELRYEIQVTDEDGLHLETPIKGSVRIRIDKPPVAIASTVHRVVLPTAKPSIQYRVGDDFGIKNLALVVEVERQANPSLKPMVSAESSSEDVSAATGVDAGGEEKKLETTRINLLTTSPVLQQRLPLADKARIDLSKLQLDPSLGGLEKGDRLKVVLVVEDYRGEENGGKGETFRSEPIIIEVSDEFGVATAVGEADPQAEQRVTEIIKRQLGIGESP